MALPTIDVPNYEVTLPISGKLIKFRPFLVKEEKILLMSLEGGEEKEMVNALCQILTNCVVDIKLPSKVKEDITNVSKVITSLPLLDFQYLFLKIRAKSAGEIIELRFRCKKLGENGEECGNIVPIGLVIDNIQLPVLEESNSLVMLTKTLGIKMHYPKYEIMNKIENWDEKTNFELLSQIVKECIDFIFDENQVYTVDNEQELDVFLESLSADQFDKILKFFENVPKLKADLNFNCKKCGHTEVIHFEGIQSFFG